MSLKNMIMYGLMRPDVTHSLEKFWYLCKKGITALLLYNWIRQSGWSKSVMSIIIQLAKQQFHPAMYSVIVLSSDSLLCFNRTLLKI